MGIGLLIGDGIAGFIHIMPGNQGNPPAGRDLAAANGGLDVGCNRGFGQGHPDGQTSDGHAHGIGIGIDPGV